MRRQQSKRTAIIICVVLVIIDLSSANWYGPDFQPLSTSLSRRHEKSAIHHNNSNGRSTLPHYRGNLAFINPHNSFHSYDKATVLYMSTTPRRQSSYSSSSSGKRRGTTQQQQTTRNRGANAANHNRRGHTFRLENNGNDRIRKKSTNTKRAPRWEREGDKLYAEVTKQLDSYRNIMDEDDDNSSSASNELLQSLANKKIASVQDVCELLEPWIATEEELLERMMKSARKKHNTTLPADVKEEKDTATTLDQHEQNTNNNKSTLPFLWGTLPVGPVLASRLHASGDRPNPTSVQRAAFSVLTAGLSKGKNKKNVPTKRTNAIIASPTGTGKTLAYILPLLCTSPGGQNGEGTGGVLIVTPTIELACQIQREVDVLWPPIDGQSSLFVVGATDDYLNNDNDAVEDKEVPPGRIVLKSISTQPHAPLIAGTPKMLRMLYREAGRIAHESTFEDEYAISREERTTANVLLSNLRAIVLDEADRLLRTEAVAREMTERKRRKMQEKRLAEVGELPPSRAKKQPLVIARQTQTELLLRDLPIPSLDDVQIICASATIGRTMRRQLMQILDKPSADAAATLITGDEDERVKSKDAERRKSVILPERLRHAFRVVNEAGSLTGVQQSSLENMSKADRNEEKRIQDTIHALWDTMSSLDDAKPIIIFPGRVGVERVQRELIVRGLDDVRTLRNLDGSSLKSDEIANVEADTIIPINMDHKWTSIPVYIIGERFCRGLDLPEVEYVFMLSPPSSAAGYAHMAGRTGRVGRKGTAITLVRAKNNEVQRLATIAEALGLKFAKSISGVAGGSGDGDSEQVLVQDDETVDSIDTTQDDNYVTTAYPWASLSDSDLKRKKNSELYEYLKDCGAPIGRRAKKADLLEAILILHSKE